MRIVPAPSWFVSESWRSRRGTRRASLSVWWRSPRTRSNSPVSSGRLKDSARCISPGAPRADTCTSCVRARRCRSTSAAANRPRKQLMLRIGLDAPSPTESELAPVICRPPTTRPSTRHGVQLREHRPPLRQVQETSDCRHSPQRARPIRHPASCTSRRGLHRESNRRARLM